MFSGTSSPSSFMRPTTSPCSVSSLSRAASASLCFFRSCSAGSASASARRFSAASAAITRGRALVGAPGNCSSTVGGGSHWISSTLEHEAIRAILFAATSSGVASRTTGSGASHTRGRAGVPLAAEAHGVSGAEPPGGTSDSVFRRRFNSGRPGTLCTPASCAVAELAAGNAGGAVFALLFFGGGNCTSRCCAPELLPAVNVDGVGFILLLFG